MRQIINRARCKFGMRLAVLLPVLALGACDFYPEPKDVAVARQNDMTIVNPPGRYQAVANPGGAGVYLIDTRVGTVRLCAATARKNDGGDYSKFAVGCTPPTS